MKILQNLLGVLSPFSMLALVWRKGEFVGADHMGHKYYRAPARKGYRREQRWVLYPDAKPNASSIPPEYHGWLHYQTDIFPSESGQSYRKNWQSGHQPNATGTTMAYQPERSASASDYQAWNP